MYVFCRLVNVIPVVPGLAGDPDPSIQESSCIHEMPIDPAAGVLKIALPDGAAVRRSVTDATVHCPAPNAASNEVAAGPRSNLSTLCASPRDNPGAATVNAPAPPSLLPESNPVGPVVTNASAVVSCVNDAPCAARDTAVTTASAAIHFIRECPFPESEVAILTARTLPCKRKTRTKARTSP